MSVCLLAVGCTNAATDDPGAASGDLTIVLDPPAKDEPSLDRCHWFGADGRAYGAYVSVAGGLVELPAFPDTNRHNPDLVIGIDTGRGLATDHCDSCNHDLLSDAVLAVEHTTTLTANSAGEVAEATVNDVALNLLGLNITATTLRARASASVSGFESDIVLSSEGSVIQNLRINGKDYLDLHEPVVIEVTDPITRTPIAEVRVLETETSAEGEISVNALHVVVFDLELTPILDESTEIIVAHADARIGEGNCD
ncbi:MAG: choice-of-anchor P family protein [Kofleriaceae bacterium]